MKNKTYNIKTTATDTGVLWQDITYNQDGNLNIVDKNGSSVHVIVRHGRFYLYPYTENYCCDQCEQHKQQNAELQQELDEMKQALNNIRTEQQLQAEADFLLIAEKGSTRTNPREHCDEFDSDTIETEAELWNWRENGR